MSSRYADVYAQLFCINLDGELVGLRVHMQSPLLGHPKLSQNGFKNLYTYYKGPAFFAWLCKLDVTGYLGMILVVTFW